MLHLFAIIFSLQNFERLQKLTADVKIDEVVSCLIVWRRLLLKKLRYNNKSRKMQVTVCYVKLHSVRQLRLYFLLSLIRISCHIHAFWSRCYVYPTCRPIEIPHSHQQRLHIRTLHFVDTLKLAIASALPIINKSKSDDLVETSR